MAVSKANVLTALRDFKTLQDAANAEKFVAKEEGKQLSSNDFSDLDKAKLNGLKNYTLPKASETVLGGVKVGDGLEMQGDYLTVTIKGGGSGDYSLPTASATTKGGVKVGTGLSMNGETLNCTVSAGTTVLASHTANGLMSSADKIKLDNVNNNAQENVIERISLDGTVQTVTNKTAVMNLSAYAKKSDVASGMKVKGSVNSYADLPANAEAGDLYNIKTAGGVDGEGVAIQAGDNVIRTANGTWDVLAGMVDFSNFVEKEDGKGLSTNDFTDADKIKLAGLSNYVLPTASETEKGGFIVGSGLSMVGDVLNVTLTGGGGGSDYQPFTGATPALDGAEGLVPAPAVKDRLKFLRGDGTWANTNNDLIIVVSPGDSVNSVVLGSPVATIQGGLWQDMIDGFPALKLRHGDYEYNYYYDTMRQVSIADSPLNTTLKGEQYVLDQLPSTLDGGLWYEVTDNNPTLMLHRGSYDYGYNYDTITYKGSNANLISYLPFESSPTADAFTNMKWSGTGTVVESPFGGYALTNTGSLASNSNSNGHTASVFTVDFWFSVDIPRCPPLVLLCALTGKFFICGWYRLRTPLPQRFA